ncbi:alpha/beta-hydrolase [Annulohypoxylon truncatum]|uniref:alpha/beta-hydrolase n=1 Tax=Annulohypoxylon truncatum TaxID=327061 RepID=UPI002007CF8B|nr:alpha/beta-hydrolase [Annulohypoxylon truncatum]KAI1206287.1 alpha/beta-hydrolase [Annulohypoxylon truncatum]
MASSLKYTRHQYGAHELQRVGVWDLDIADKAKYWIIFIHGGAWRDPRVTHEVFAPSISRILESTSDGTKSPSSSSNVGKSSIAAFASIDYRLSPHPDFPQDPARTPKDQLRDARHPDHLDDVRAALAFLQRSYDFGARYVLLGHSAGACLTYQLLATAPPLSSSSRSGSSADETRKRERGGGGGGGDPELPAAALGIEGIYDMAGLNARVGGSYAEFLTAAFGPPGRWDEAAPMKFAGRYRERFTTGLAALAHSPDDELVDMPETEGMAERLRGDLDEERVLVFKDLEGSHEGIVQDGSGVARVVLRILEVLGGADGGS